MKKKQLPIAALALAGILTLGAGAAATQSITAALRPDIAVVVNGVEQETMTDVTGKRVYPISYNNTVYLPIRALGDVLSHDADWDGDSQTISLTAKERLPAFTDAAGAEKAIAALEKEITALKSATTYEGRARQYAEYSTKLEHLANDTDRVSAQVKSDYDFGRISYSDYRALVARLNKVGERRKAALNTLEEKTIADTSGYQSAYDYNLDRLDALDTALETVERSIKNLVSGSDYAERLRQYTALDKELSPLQSRRRALVNDINEDQREKRLTYAQYSTLTTQADDLDSRMKTARAELERKTVSIGDEAPEQIPGGADYKSFAAQIADLEKRSANEIQNAEKYKVAQGANNNKQAWRNLLDKLDALDREADRLDDALEQAWRQNKLTQSEYRGLDQTLERLEDRLDRAQDRLEDLYDNDRDDDRWDDDDRYDDDWYDDDRYDHDWDDDDWDD